MKYLKLIFLFFISIGFYSCAEFQNASQSATGKENKTRDFCPTIYGRWEACNVYSPTYPSKKKQIWTFDINGALTVDQGSFKYRLEEDCSKLFIDNKSTYSSIEIRNDTLLMNIYSINMCPFTIKLKKLN